MNAGEDMELINRVILLSDESRLARFWRNYRFWRTNREAYYSVLHLLEHHPEMVAELNAEVIPDPDTLNIGRRFVGLWKFYQQDTMRYHSSRYKAQRNVQQIAGNCPPIGHHWDSAPMMDNFARRLMMDITLLRYHDVLPDMPYSTAHCDGKSLPLTLRLEYENRVRRWEDAQADGRNEIDYAARLECNWYARWKLKPDGRFDRDTYPPCSLGHGLDPVLDKHYWEVEHFKSSEDDGTEDGNWYAGWRLKFDDDSLPDTLTPNESDPANVHW